jgi:hypothetical protein
MGDTLLLRIAAMSPTMVSVPRRARSMFEAFVRYPSDEHHYRRAGAGQGIGMN